MLTTGVFCKCLYCCEPLVSSGYAYTPIAEPFKKFHDQRPVKPLHRKICQTDAFCVYDENKAGILAGRLKNSSTEVLSGMEGLLEIAGDSTNDLTVTAIVGMIGIRPTLAAIEAGCNVALANKETLVTAGHIIMKAVKEHKVNLLPIDSEHSAIFHQNIIHHHKHLERELLKAIYLCWVNLYMWFVVEVEMLCM